MSGRLAHKKILLGITGSIAAYKSCELLRMMQREGAEVRVVMTQSAQKFITPLTLETLSGNEVVKEMFPSNRVIKTRHVSLAEWADTLFICPASANLIGKVASGIADDFLSTVIMASRRPVIFAPAMDYEMVQNPIYLDNIEKLKRFGYHFIDPQEGHLASGAKGPGRLADFFTLFENLNLILNKTNSLAGKRILISAGPTQEDLDPIRFFTNRSSGKMGYALATAACLRGADVTLVSGPVNLEVPIGVRLYSVRTAIEMRDAIFAAWPQNDVLIMAAAVADFRPREYCNNKIKKSQFDAQLALAQNPDILQELTLKESSGYKVGFALETDNTKANALKKMNQKKLDMICLNDPSEKGAGFQGDTNRITIFTADDQKHQLPLLSKADTAEEIWNVIETYL
ncbi:bifunctional phosphopantothenoylcysteine decarboxylase/phosphopantothenate--cysteine ligase CoaBC [bacterium]|nr:bifunctional phosphopantothenoylcysteine decarboxylase/phosphopantothenate--cysteine ligase CoaBC [bacterium]